MTGAPPVVLRTLGGSALLLIALVRPMQAQTKASLPEGAGADVARSACLSCHGAALIESQRLSQIGWDREVAKMERWATPLPAADRAWLVEYLAANFGLVRTPAGPGAARVEAGRAVYQRACVGCHGDAIVRSQRLTRDGWTRSIAKMTQWGAAVRRDDVDALVDYLVALAPS